MRTLHNHSVKGAGMRCMESLGVKRTPALAEETARGHS